MKANTRSDKNFTWSKIHTGTTSKVDRKLFKKSTRYGSEDLYFPSMSIVLGTSGMREMVALKNASAGIEIRWVEYLEIVE